MNASRVNGLVDNINLCTLSVNFQITEKLVP